MRLICCPTYNERENLPHFVYEVMKQASSVEVLVVDDGSPDGTGEIAESLAEKTGRCRVLRGGGMDASSRRPSQRRVMEAVERGTR